MILIYFPSGGCVDDVVNNRENYKLTSVIVIHFMNGQNIRRTVFRVCICLNHREKYKHNQIERRHEKTRH